jgi:ABC-type sugar transport system permease subunit
MKGDDMSVDSTTINQTPPLKVTSHWFRQQAKIAPYIFVSPFFILFFIFFLFPGLSALLLSFFKWNGIGSPDWIGLRNFERIFTDPDFWQAVVNTFIYMIASLFIVVPMSLVLASVLNSRTLKLKGLWRSSFFSPIVTSSVAIALVFLILYSKDYGLLNTILDKLGLPFINWLDDKNWAKVSIILLIMWRWTGYTSIYFLAGMQTISEEYYEAAMIDGANAFQQFRRITLPLLRPIILYVSILVTTGSLQIFEETYILTRGGPANATLSVAQYLYNQGISNLKFGFGSAVGLILFMTIFSLSALQLRTFGIFRED